LKAPGFNPCWWSLKFDILVSKFAFKCNVLCRYNMVTLINAGGAVVGLYTLSALDPP
jgi:hypothetical protein